MLLNHVPTVGFGLALAMFLVALARRNDGLKRTSLALFFVVATVAIATYVTGNGAESVIKGRPDVSQTAIRAHEDAALLAFTFMEVTGFFAWLALWQWRRVPRLAALERARRPAAGGRQFPAHGQGRHAWRRDHPRGDPVRRRGDRARRIRRSTGTRDITTSIRRNCSSGTRSNRSSRNSRWRRRNDLFEAMGYGKVADQASARAAGARDRPSVKRWPRTAAPSEPSGTARVIGLFVSGQTWVWPTCETLHFVGLCMLFTVVLIVDLRMLGMIKSVSFEAVYQLLPIGMLGFGINLVTGMLFFIGVPGQYVHNGTFFFKIVFVLLGGLNVLYFTLDDEPWAVKAGEDAPLTAKIAAASAIFVWVAVLFCGHMLPFIGNAF